ncbi:MAG: hypothetical protein H6840_00090 [Planctomycetes bacterium]|nr:hypothetical protein [Planctomycetota bacterium]
MNAMPDQAENPNAALLRHGRRVQWIAGLCFALLFLMGVSGLASITLLHDDRLYTDSMQGVEGATLRTVIALRGVIGLIHAWGGYLGIMLAGFAGLEVLRFARLLRKAERADWRGTGRWLGPLGVLGGLVVMAALVLLLASGVSARGYVRQISARHSDELSGIDRSRALGSAAEERKEFPRSEFAEMHVKELNYLMAAGAILLVLAASVTRRIELEAKK